MALNRESVIRNAEKYVSKGKLEAGIKEYRKVLAENPNDANTLNRVGDLYARIERFDEAVKLFTQIAEQYTRDGFFVKAIAIYKKIIKLDPGSLQVYERLAELYYKQGLLNEARTQYQVLADYYQKHDNAASAISIFQKMAEIEPENPTFHLKLAELYESQRLTDKALASYRQLADLLIVNGSIEEAAQVFLRALDIGSDDLDFIRSTVVGLHEGGHVGAAAKVLARAVESNPAAAALSEEIGLAETQQQPEADTAAEEAPPDDAAGEPSEPGEDAAAVDDSEPPAPDFGAAPALDDTDATSASASGATFADLEAEAADADAADVASFAGAGSDDDEELEVFTLDLEDDEIPETLVAPPPDMLEPAAEEDSGEAPEAAAAAAEAPDEEAEAGDEPSFEIDLSEVELEPAEPGTAAEDLEPAEAEAAGSAEAESAPAAPGFELSIDLEDDEDEQPSTIDLADAASGEPAVFELADEDRAAAAEPADLGTEPTDLEPEELEAAEVDLAEIDLELEPPQPEPTDLEPAALEPARGESAGPPIIRREEDLLAEARVFAKYGLEEKALDRLGELFELQESHLEGLELKTRIFFEAGRHQEAQAAANEVARVAQETGNLGPWHELRADLVDAGYAIEDEQVLDEPLQKPADDDRIAQLLEDLSLEDFDSTALAPLEDAVPATSEMPSQPGAPQPGAPQPGAPQPGAPQPGAPESEEAVTASPPPRPLAAEPEPKKKLVSLVEELGLEDLQDDPEELAAAAAEEASAAAEPKPTAEAAATAETTAETAADLDETGMSWLDDVAGSEEIAADRDEELFEEEDDFFDLAAELERELTEDDLADGGLVEPQEQSLEDIIEGFKQGVAENLSAEDYETHFNLGIAYREMGLIDEAIGEFQLASKDDRYLVDCSSLLGSCFLEKGLPELAVRWYRKGLEAPAINDEATMGLLYDMGNAYLSLGDSEAASKTFIEIYGQNSNYRDVSTKLEELGAVP